MAARIRPKVPRQAQSLTPGDLDDGVMPLQELAEMPSAKAPALASAGLVVLCLLVGILGPGSRPLTRSLAPDSSTFAGQDPAASEPVELDLAGPIEVVLRGLPSTTGNADEVELTLSAGGIPLGRAGPEDLEAMTGGATATLDAGGGRYVAVGALIATLELRESDEVVFTHQFRARSAQPGFRSVPGGIAIILLAVAVAYAETFLRPLRRGRRAPGSLVGMALVGGAVGLLVVMSFWLMGPTATHHGDACGLGPARRLGRRQQDGRGHRCRRVLMAVATQRGAVGRHLSRPTPSSTP